MYSDLTLRLWRAASAFARDEDGAGLVEYALIIAVVALGVIGALVFLAGGIADAFEMISDHVEAAITNEDPVEVGRRRGRGWCIRFGC
ncbi:MAG: Flp family type IVb pilin [Candidatus Limnocylindria bacterium]